MNNINRGYVRAFRFFKTQLGFAFILISAPVAYAAEQDQVTRNCENIITTLDTVSFDVLLENSTHHPALQDLGNIYGRRTPTEQAIINESLTETHKLKEMSFQTRNPETGFYDRFTAVPVNGHIAPVMEKDFDRLVQSTGPVLRALRSLLQKIYGGAELSVAGLGLQNLPPPEAELLLRVLRESIYFEPKLVAPQMSEYPFLAVSGFDGAIVNPTAPESVFFELNLGTPSGLSNNTDLLESLSRSDSEVRNAISPYLPDDDTFEILRQTMADNATAWTGRDGIVVAISPGIYNGAHADVAAIARRAGFPLVKSSDLYEDAKGLIRMKTGYAERDPVVAGIYNRMEESFLFQSNSDGIPMISPEFENPEPLAKRFGVELRSGAIYSWIRDEQGNISGVERDANGAPKFQEIWDTMGVDPSRPNAPAGSFAKAVLGRKLYVSNVGGRLVDDKRLFRAVAKYLAASTLGLEVAHPVDGPERLEELFANPDRFVIKSPANSGGVGIHFPRAMSEEDTRALLERVRESPGDFEIQNVSPIATLPDASLEDFAEVAIDLRLFVMMSSRGDVDAGPNSLLVRTAPRGGLYSNTSRGGGYGIGVVLGEKATGSSSVRSWYVETTLAQRNEGVALFKDLISLHQRLDSAPIDELRNDARALSYRIRDIMSVLSSPMMALPSVLRDFAEGGSSAVLVRAGIERAMVESRRTFGPLDSSMSMAINENFQWWMRILEESTSPMSATYNPLNDRIHYQALKEPTIAYYWQEGDRRFEKYEMAEILSVDDPTLQGMIDFVRQNGGQVRLMKTREMRANDPKPVGWRFESPYFWVNLDPDDESYLIPVIGIDLTADRAIAALSHEMEHFKVWLDRYRERIAVGETHEEATKNAVADVWQLDMIVYGERRAVAAEMAAERAYPNHPFNKSRGLLRPSEPWQRGYVNRVTYPEFQAVRQLLHQHVAFKTDLDTTLLRKYLLPMVKTALESKALALADERVTKDVFLNSYWLTTPISKMLIEPYGIERLQDEHTVDLFLQNLIEACREFTGGLEQCG